MRPLLSTAAAIAVTLAVATGSLGLTGCGASLEEAATPLAASVAGRTINGHVHGGVYPIQNATIRLMATQTSTESFTDGKGTHAGGAYGGAAAPLLKTTSDKNGYFTFPETGWKCNTDQFAYITVSGGYTSNLSTTTANNSVVQVGVIGSCATFQTQAAYDNINVFVSELSTVAAAAALGNFTTIDTTDAANSNTIVNIGAPDSNSSTSNCTGSGSTLSCTAAGLAHGFTNAVTLVNSVTFNAGGFPNGQANTTNAASNVSSIPAPLINTVGDILQQCVDSIGTNGSLCQSLFTATMPPGGTAPTNTLQSAINMVKYPTNNIAALYAMQTKTPPFTPALSSAPTSFAVSIFYGVSYDPNKGIATSNVPYPVDVALDYADNAYVLYANGQPGTAADTYSSINKWGANGQLLVQGTGTAGGFLHPTQVAIDPTGVVYATNNDPNANNAGLLAWTGGYLHTLATLTGASGLAVDNSGNAWVSSTSTSANQGSLTAYAKASLNTASGATAPYNFPVPVGLGSKTTSGAFGSATGVAVDGNQNLWAAGLSGSVAQAIALPNTGSASAPSYAAGGGVHNSFATAAPYSVAVNSANKTFFPTQGVINSATFSSGVISVTKSAAITQNSNVPHRSQVDGAGNVLWTDLENSGLLYIYSPLNGSVLSFLPCFVFPSGSNFYCITTSTQTAQNSIFTPANLRSMAIDSAGNVWYVADAGLGAVIETLGLAAPTWPLLSYGHPGVKP